MWYYEVLRDLAVLFVGKVEGKGVSAAVFTGAIRGALSMACQTSKSMTIETPNLKSIVAHVNSVIYGITSGKQKLTCFIALMDLRTGRIEMVNAGHPVPYLLRAKTDKKVTCLGEVSAITSKKA